MMVCLRDADFSYGMHHLICYVVIDRCKSVSSVEVGLLRSNEFVGYRHIDCAQLYGNEKEIGLALKKLFEDGVVARKDLWITSKLWCSNHAPEDVHVALEKNLNNLQSDYLDLYHIHWPVRTKKRTTGFQPENLLKTDIPATWKAMEALYDSGKTRG
ncbi:hypothetical protein L1887_15804 [Cichorium endivia]|nr:hypothetical protein L1887_15804 [Cichorium endivia]